MVKVFVKMQKILNLSLKKIKKNTSGNRKIIEAITSNEQMELYEKSGGSKGDLVDLNQLEYGMT